MARLSEASIASLKTGLQGEVLQPGSDAYEESRRIWNAMIDRKPAIIVRCAATSDVVRAVNFARQQRLPLAIRAGGHNIGGSALVDGGLVIDLSRLRAAQVDAAARRVTIEAGALLADLDAATQAHGLATPVGINSTTGVAGLTLGGGFGWLSRKLGMTVDNLESAEVVTAAGEVVRASAKEHPDLFWALRGGGGNFGVVTRFEFRLHPVGPNLLSGLVVYGLDEAGPVLRRYREFALAAPDDLTVWVVIRKAPPLPFLPPEVHGREVVVLAMLYAGDPAEGERLTAPLHSFGRPLGAHAGVQPYAGWQQAFDPLLAAGARNYWKSHNLTGLPDGLLDTLVEHAAHLPTPSTEIILAALGGATMRPAPDATAYAARDTRFIVNIHGRWEDASDDARGIGWTRTLFQAAAPFATGAAYINFMTADEQDRVRAVYGVNFDRLAKVKRTYDPANLFSVNQNIAPAA
ncbi:MAG TPA: FAD-binding oxidoreductase [Candidatus Polarisedimenticolia bacterium]|nr:FAD-binding oxidoreductase [Candidatus Polarisedimenticolia bacterium]